MNPVSMAENWEENEIMKMGKLQRSIKRWGPKVLQEIGTGKEWNEVEDIQR
jgi:hypothetical protein